MGDKEIKDFVENVTASLVREYLSRKGLKSVLQVLEQELPRHKNSISNRGTLIQVLHLEKAVKRNKASLHPLRTVLEIITKDLVVKYQQSKILTGGLENQSADYCSSLTAAPQNSPAVYTPSAKTKDEINSEDLGDNNSREDIKNEKNDSAIIPDPSSLNFEQKTLDKYSCKQLENSEDVSKHSILPKVKRTSGLINVSHELVKTSKNQSLLKESYLLGPRNESQQTPDNQPKHKCGFGPVSSTYQNPRERRRLRGTDNSLQSDQFVHLPSQSEKERDKIPFSHKEKCVWDFQKPSFVKSINDQCISYETDIYFKQEMDNKNQELFLSKTKAAESIMIEKKKELAKSKKDIQNDIELCDLSDADDMDVCDFVTQSHLPSHLIPDYSCIRPITMEEACKLKILLFGNSRECFGQEWTKQGFTFCDLPSITYGIIQNKAGPCGVLAAVQAHFLCEILFGTMDHCLQNGCLRPKKKDQNKALSKALATILWQAGESTQAIFAVNTKRQVLDTDDFITSFKADGVLECLVLRVFNSFDVLLNFLDDIIPKMEDDGSCVTFLYSAILTRGLERMKADMDHPNSRLIGQYGYCSQEIVNLLLIGQAVSNVFDGDVELNTGGKDKTILHGISVTSRIGLLSLYEYQNTCEVGSYYKNPLFPIWIISGESHFSVLFATSQNVRELQNNEPFCLFYFDGLANQEKEICLTVDPGAGKHLSPGTEDDYLSPVERCIRTRWKGSSVNWNGTNPDY